MSQPGSLRIDTAKITSFEAVLAELHALDTRLIENNLRQFVVFNKAYYVVTEAIQRAARNNYFENPQFIEKFTTHFAHYYFRAVNDTVAANPGLPAAWAKVNKTAQQISVPTFLPLLMGANAHINHDLPLALLDLMGKEKTDALLGDVLKIDTLLMKSGREILGVFDEPNKVLDVLKRRARYLYYRPVMYMILYWRISAWRSYKSLKRNAPDKHDYKTKSTKIAGRLLKLGSYLG